MQDSCDCVGRLGGHGWCFLAAGLAQLALGCAPIDQFRTLTMYDYDVINRGCPEDDALAEIPHFVMSARQTQEFFSGSAYRGPGLGMVWLRSYFGVVQLDNGQKYNIGIYPFWYVWKPLGKLEYYRTACSDAQEEMWRRTLRGRVFLPLWVYGDIQGWWAGTSKMRVVEVDGRYGYADRATNSLVIPCRFSDALPFSEGLAAVRVDEAEGCKWGYIDEAGKFVIESQFDGAFPFSEGLAVVTVGEELRPPTVGDVFGGKQGYIDRAGKMVLAPQFRKAYPFYGGLATVFTENRMLDIDKTGAVVKTYSGLNPPRRYEIPPRLPPK